MVSESEIIGIDINGERIRHLRSVTVDTALEDPSGSRGRYSVTGPLFKDFLIEYGISQGSFRTVRLIARDGYSVEVPREVLQRCDLILAHTMNGQLLNEEAGLVRVIAPGEKPIYWISNLSRVELLGEMPHLERTRLFVLETLITQVKTEDYTYCGSTDKAVRVKNLLRLLGKDGLSGTASFLATDGFKKNERLEIFSRGFIKFTGEDAPAFLAPDLPLGMHIKNIFFCTVGDTVLISLQSATGLRGDGSTEGKKGIKLKPLIQQAGLGNADKFQLITVDGCNVELLQKDMERSLIFKNVQGQADIFFEDAEGGTYIENVVSIEKCAI